MFTYYPNQKENRDKVLQYLYNERFHGNWHGVPINQIKKDLGLSVGELKSALYQLCHDVNVGVIWHVGVGYKFVGPMN